MSKGGGEGQKHLVSLLLWGASLTPLALKTAALLLQAELRIRRNRKVLEDKLRPLMGEEAAKSMGEIYYRKVKEMFGALPLK